MSDERSEAIRIAKHRANMCKGMGQYACCSDHALLAEVSETTRQHDIISRLHDEKTAQSMDFVKVVKALDDAKAQLADLGNEYAIVCHWKHRVEQAEALVAAKDDALDKIANAEKHGHWHSDAYTRAACFQERAAEGLALKAAP